MRPKIQKTARHFRRIPHWVFLSLFVFFSLVAVFALRQNNLTMVHLREAVYKADKDNGDVNTALNNLRSYVYGHMNTNLSSGGNTIKPPIQLKYTYERLQTAEQQRINGVNSKVYTEAENYCQSQIPEGFSGRGRVPCVTDYVTTHGVKANAIPAALYQFDFANPAWSPDFAGWSLLLAIIFLLAFLANVVIDKILGAYIQTQEI